MKWFKFWNGPIAVQLLGTFVYLFVGFLMIQLGLMALTAADTLFNIIGLLLIALVVCAAAGIAVTLVVWVINGCKETPEDETSNEGSANTEGVSERD